MPSQFLDTETLVRPIPRVTRVSGKVLNEGTPPFLTLKRDEFVNTIKLNFLNSNVILSDSTFSTNQNRKFSHSHNLAYYSNIHT